MFKSDTYFDAISLLNPAILLLVSIVFFFNPNLAKAKSVHVYGNFIIQHYDQSDGLISSQVTGTYTGKMGFLWISTYAGLSRFDGKNFINYNIFNGLKENNIEIIGEDARRLFVKSKTGIYQFTGNHFSPFRSYPTNGNYIQAACPGIMDDV